MMSRSVVLDTNVLISAAIKESSVPAEILKKIILREMTLLTCPGIVEEYKQVFARPKFKKWRFPPLWFDFVLAQSIWVDHDPPLWPVSGPDPDDLIFLSFSYQQGATLITGNMKDYPKHIRQGTVIVEPSEYLAWIRKV
ncbi:MAG: putative toxin-antitoxin system toxin component, PIN family [Bdellovibrionia bacterium]